MTGTPKATPARAKARVLYISTFQFSGSTLASFLLNTHSQMATVGHTIGWHFAEGEDFRCSCGELLDICPYFTGIAKAFAENGLRFDIRDFGTNYRLAKNERLNRYLVASLPVIANTSIEHLRDRFIRNFGSIEGRISTCDRANEVFFRSAIELANASVYVDNSHDPYRARHLNRIPGLDVRNLHLVRDPRGVALSCRRHAGWSVDTAMQTWLRRLRDIIRIGDELPGETLVVHYEDLCRNVDTVLADIHRFAGLEAEPFAGDFDASEHHILGNAMRLRGGDIRLDEKWKTALDAADVDRIGQHVSAAVSADRDGRLTDIVERFVA